MVSAAAVGSIAPERLDGVVLLDVSNALDFSAGFPPTLALPGGASSVAAHLQRLHPAARVVKALNTVNAGVMVDPGTVGSDHQLPIAGDDEAAKDVVRGLLRELGWRDSQLLDLGGLAAAAGMEHYILLWLSLMNALGTPQFNIAVRQ
jgi:predicted dinucleotide-binding enzyme